MSDPDRSTEDKALFRKEAVDHVVNRQFGQIILTNELSFKIVGIVSMLVAISLVILFVTCRYQRKVQIMGVLSPASGIKRIVSPQSGMIFASNVNEGQLVHKNDTLFVISSSVTSVTGGDTGQSISTSLRNGIQSLVETRAQQITQGFERETALLKRISSLRLQGNKDNAQIELQKSNVVIAQNDYSRQLDLSEHKFVSPNAAELKKGDWQRQQQTLLSLESDQASHLREMHQAESDLKDLRTTAKLTLAASDRDLQAFQQRLAENESHRQILINAPEDGFITAINIESGQVAVPNQGLAVLVPERGLLFAELYAPSRAAGFVKIGMEVVIDYPAYPYQKFGHQKGKVTEVANTAMRPEDMTLPGAPQAANNEAVYRIRVELEQQKIVAYGEQKMLRSGMSVEARVVLDERTLAEWALEPLLSVKGRL